MHYGRDVDLFTPTYGKRHSCNAADCLHDLQALWLPTGQYLLDVLASVNTAVTTQHSFQQSLGIESSSGCTVGNLSCPCNDTPQSQVGGNKDSLSGDIPHPLTIPHH